MKKLAIQGHKTRSNEVIELLEMLGGKNSNKLVGFDDKFFYHISNKIICSSYIGLDEIKEYKIFSLEEFLEKFSYKVGNKVKTIYGKIGIVEQLVWSNKDNAVRYKLENDKDSLYFVNELQPYKKETITIDDFKANTKEWLIDNLQSMSKDNALQTICNIYDELHKPKYPKTYEECCDKLDFKGGFREIFLSENEFSLYTSFIKLIRCRDSYWKIAGEEMGLGKPWRPDWNNDKVKYGIVVEKYVIEKRNFCNLQVTFSFPTEEIRDAFYENFKDLIEQCKELL